MKAKASKGWRLDTSCVHAGEGVDSDTRAIRRPIHMANSYELPTDVDQLMEVFSWDHLDKFQYTREHSATPRHLEERLAALEGSEDCVVAASGMGAISAALFSLLAATTSHRTHPGASQSHWMRMSTPRLKPSRRHTVLVISRYGNRRFFESSSSKRFSTSFGP